ncbi:MAG: tetratricopeptide repeat protein, partial [Chitinophagales bacterium]|nr:tetratricopeptide repeat protein [Chitinophagales bacterium]
MLSGNQNKVGNITGNHNQVIQIILSDGEKIEDTLGALVAPLLSDNKERIKDLEKQIDSKEEALEDKREIVKFQKSEIIQLKSELAEQKVLLEESEERFTKIFLENDGKDFTGSKEIYPRALKALSEGDKEKALQILARQEMLEQKKKLDQEKEQQAASWLLRADLLKDENKWGGELNECYDLAAEIFSNWNNNLEAANHFKFINDFDKARNYYHICLQRATSDYEKATTLNNLAVLQWAKNEYSKAEQSYDEALGIYRELAETNPQTYLPYVAMTLNNLGNLQRAQNEYSKAEQSYQEALGIRRQLAETNPQTYLPYVAMTLNNLGNLQRAQNE